MSKPWLSATDHAVVKGAVLRETSAAYGLDSTTIASYLPYPESTVWSALYALWKAGQVERQRVGRTSYWRRVK